MFKNVVIPIDFSDKKSIKAIFPPALNLVNAFGAKIHLIHIIPDFGLKVVEEYLPRHWLQDQENKSKTQISDLIKQYIPEEIKVEMFVGRGPIYDQVIKYAEDVNADLIIVAAIRSQLKDYMLGTNASKIARHSRISVLVVRE